MSEKAEKPEVLQICANCRHMAPDGSTLVCLRFPPVPIGKLYAEFPRVREEWHCWEWMTRIEGTGDG